MKELNEELWNVGGNLLYLAACGLQGRTPSAEQMAAMDLCQIYRMAEKHSMRAVAYYGLQAWFASADPAPAEAEEVLSRWKEAYHKAIRKNLLFDIERERLEAFMEEQGIWYMPLKGSLLKEWYPQAGMREMADNDILIDPAFRYSVRNYLVAQGYEAPDYIPSEAEEQLVTYSVHDNYYKKPIYNFEIHFALFGSNAEVALWARYYENVKERLLKAENSEHRYRFCEEDCYVYMTTHASKHFNGGGHGLRNLMDVAIFLREKPRMNWAYIEQELDTLGLAEHESIVRSLACKVFDPDFWEKQSTAVTLTAKEQEMLALCISAGTYGTARRRLHEKDQ